MNPNNPLGSPFPRGQESSHVGRILPRRDSCAPWVTQECQADARPTSNELINLKQHRKSPLTHLLQSGELQPTLQKGVERSGGGFDFVSYCRSGIFAIPVSLNHSLTVEFHGKCFKAIAVEVIG